jgi:hypothetical protein
MSVTSKYSLLYEGNINLYSIINTISDLVGKVEKRARNPWITQEMISKMDERRKWKNVNTEKAGGTTED